MRRLALLFFFFASPALAQFTVVSGTVTDSNGLPYSQASVTVTLSLPTGSLGAYLNGAQIAGTVNGGKTDNNGAFLLRLGDNTLIQCANAQGQLVACAPQTQWTFSFNESPGILPPVGNGPQTCAITLTISGSAQTATLPNCPALVKNSTANTADKAISPLNFGAKYDVRYESDCTFNSTTTVVCPSGNFTSADALKIEFGTNAVQPHGSGSLITNPVIMPQGTIVTAVNSTTVITSIAATANCTPTANNLCWFAWGSQDDTTPIASAQAAAWFSVPCLLLQMPSGAAFVTKGGLGSSSGNACSGSGDFGQVGPELAGMGQGATVLVPLPSFDFTTCTNAFSGAACFGGALGLRAHDFQINGMGQTLSGTTHNNNLFELDGGNFCAGASAANLKFHDWGLMSTGLTGFDVHGACDAGIINSTMQDFGNSPCNIEAGSGAGSNVSLTGLGCFGGNTGPSLGVSMGSGTGALVSSTGGFYGSCLTGTCNDVLVSFNGASNTVFTSSGDQIFASSAAQQNVIQMGGTAGAGSVVNLWGDILFMEGACATTCNVATVNTTGSGQLRASQTLFSGNTNTRLFFIAAGNSFVDIGGNTFNRNGGLADSISGSVFGSYSITGTPITAAKLVLSAGWGTTAAWTALTGNTQYLTGTITASGAGQAANPTITYTFPTPFLVAPTGCFGLQVGGTQAAVANPFTPSGLTATGVTFTYNGTPVAGNTFFVQLECWSM